jgi:hypothetical protein
MAETCAYPGCGQQTFQYVHGTPSCSKHEIYFLKERLERLWPCLEIRDGEVCTPTFLNTWARFLERHYEKLPNGLTKQKLANRTYAFLKRGSKLYFSIERHPVLGTFEQRWRYDFREHRLELIQERCLSSPYKRDQRGRYLCPRCKNPLQNITYWLIQCPCGYEERYVSQAYGEIF